MWHYCRIIQGNQNSTLSQMSYRLSINIYPIAGDKLQFPSGKEIEMMVTRQQWYNWHQPNWMEVVKQWLKVWIIFRFVSENIHSAEF